MVVLGVILCVCDGYGAGRFVLFVEYNATSQHEHNYRTIYPSRSVDCNVYRSTRRQRGNLIDASRDKPLGRLEARHRVDGASSVLSRNSVRKFTSVHGATWDGWRDSRNGTYAMGSGAGAGAAVVCATTSASIVARSWVKRIVDRGRC